MAKLYFYYSTMNAGKSTTLLQCSYNYQQVKQLSDVCDQLDVPVMAYGLRTDFQGNLFAGSEVLLAWADTLTEIKTICHCGRKATMVLRIDDSGRPIKDGRQIQIGGNERYVSVCRRHVKEAMCERAANELPLLDSLDGAPAD